MDENGGSQRCKKKLIKKGRDFNIIVVYGIKYVIIVVLQVPKK